MVNSASDLNPPAPKLWYAVYTIVRHEKSVNASLIDKSVETFLPTHKVSSKWKDRRKILDLPLFPGYLFVHVSLDDRLRVLRTKGVVNILGVKGVPTPVPVEQINSLKTLLESDQIIDPYPYYDRGTEVIVTRGPLTGIRGRIEERKGEHRLVISVDLIKRAVSVEVDIEDVELL